MTEAAKYILHYMKCADSNCARMACVDRRDFKRRIEHILLENAQLKSKLAEAISALDKYSKNH